MPDNRINASLSSDAQTAVMTALSTAKDKLSFLTGLTPEERQALPKMGDKTVAFVAKALDVAKRHPEILPGNFDAQAFITDAELVNALRPVQGELRDLLEKVDDTVLAAGSEAFSAALRVYQFAKTNGLDGELDTELAEMSKRFARRPRTPQPPTSGG